MNTLHADPVLPQGESSRWWWPSAAAGAAAALAVVAIVGSSSAGNAVPTEPARYSTPVVTQPSIDIPPGWRQCFMEQATWNTVLDGPQPICPID